MSTGKKNSAWRIQFGDRLTGSCRHLYSSKCFAAKPLDAEHQPKKGVELPYMTTYQISPEKLRSWQRTSSLWTFLGMAVLAVAVTAVIQIWRLRGETPLVLWSWTVRLVAGLGFV